MASTALTLSPHWDACIETEVRSDRYASASEVMRAGLRKLADKTRRLQALQAHLAEGADQAARGAFVTNFDVESVIEPAKRGARAGFG